MKKVIIILVLLISAIGATILWMNSNRTSADTIPATVEDVTGMVKLCALEIHDDVPMRDSINGKWIFAKGKVNGYVTFDVEQMQYEVKGDTIVVILPPENVEIYESTDKGAYRVYDSWDNSLFGNNVLTVNEENLLKERLKQRYIKAIYSKGYVRRARMTAKETLTKLFGHLDGVVILEDPCPEGYGLKSNR